MGGIVKLFEQQDDKGSRGSGKTRTKKLLRRMKHKRERQQSKLKGDEHAPTYKKYQGWAL